jgi:hypothetical protein
MCPGDQLLEHTPLTSPLKLHSPCGEKEQPGGEIAGVIELINEPLPLKGRGATI